MTHVFVFSIHPQCVLHISPGKLPTPAVARFAGLFRHVAFSNDGAGSFVESVFGQATTAIVA